MHNSSWSPMAYLLRRFVRARVLYYRRNRCKLHCILWSVEKIQVGQQIFYPDKFASAKMCCKLAIKTIEVKFCKLIEFGWRFTVEEGCNLYQKETTLQQIPVIQKTVIEKRNYIFFIKLCYQNLCYFYQNNVITVCIYREIKQSKDIKLSIGKLKKCSHKTSKYIICSTAFHITAQVITSNLIVDFFHLTQKETILFFQNTLYRVMQS